MNQDRKKEKPAPPIKEGSAESFFAANDAPALRRKAVEIEGYRYWVHALTGIEANELLEEMERDEEGRVKDPYCDAKWIQRCTRNGKDELLFTETQIPKIAGSLEPLILKLLNECLAINGMNEIGRQRIAKNLEPTPGVDS